MAKEVSNFKADWKEASRKERTRYIIITIVMLILGGLGIYKAILFAEDRELSSGLTAMMLCLLMLAAGKIPWRERR